MYSIYSIQKVNGQSRFEFLNQISLAGYKSGIIAKHLKEYLISSDNPPIGWTLPISEYYNKRNQAIIIDIKPKSKNETVLCELDTVFGFSHPGWSPIMLRLKELFNENTDDLGIDKFDFNYPDKHQILYTMTYLQGSFKDGELNGTWNFPGLSSTNGLLMWPEAITFFNQQIKKLDPAFLKEEIKLISSQK